MRLGFCLVCVGLPLVWSRLGDPFFSPERRAARREERLTRAARRLAALLGDLKGAFVKAGQFASLRIDMLPSRAREALASLQDRVPPLPLEVVRGVVESELGAPLEALFPRFDPNPLGTASIAQVHHAALPDGREVAVKVQHPWLEASLPADLGVIRLALAGFSFLRGRGRVDQRRVFEEFAAGLAEELDFEREAQVATEIAANLAHESQIVVPEIVKSHTTRRVLTMRYQPAVPILDRATLSRLGVVPGDVLEVLARAYAKQVFVDGLFHADPHPGNLFVLDEPGASLRPRVLFVDFGLSKRLDPTLRQELRKGIYALLQRDLGAFLSGMERMGMIAEGAQDRVRTAVSAIFTLIREGGGTPLAMSGSAILVLKDEAKTLLQSTDGLHLPNELLLYAKTLSYLFQLGAELDPSVDLMRLSVPFLLRFLAEGS